MVLDGDTLYVADTENHLIRQIDLRRNREDDRRTGQQSHEYGESGAARSVALNSPWDLQLVGRTLYIAMAGPHQIWQLELDKQRFHVCRLGREARLDGALDNAALRSHRALGRRRTTLYVSDAEANIIRAIDLRRMPCAHAGRRQPV